MSFTVPGGGTGGVFGTLGGFPDVILPGGFCGAGATCNTPSASSGIGPLGAYLNRKNPIKETILWDSSTIPPSALNANSCGANKTIITCFPNNVTFYDESSTALAANQPSEPMNAPGHIHFCADPPKQGRRRQRQLGAVDALHRLGRQRVHPEHDGADRPAWPRRAEG